MRNSNISLAVLFGGINSSLWLLCSFLCPEEGLEIFERKSRKNLLLIFNDTIADSASTQVEFIPETDNPEVSFIKRE